MKLSENIKQIRKEKKLTQEQLADAMGVSTASVSKWETGQSAPDLTVLLELADFFEVSVDTLMGHVVKANRMDKMIERMKALREEENYEEAKQIGEKILRSYPNEYRAVEAVSNLYHSIYLYTGEENSMLRAIELTERLFALVDDPTGVKRLELVSRMANHYELLEDWEKARKYYKEGNVSRANDRALARCRANAGKDREAAKEVSDVFFKGLFEVLSDCLILGHIWEELEQYDMAEAVLNWGCMAIKEAGSEIANVFSGLLMMMYVELAGLESKRESYERAKEHIRLAVSIARSGRVETDKQSFLENGERNVIVHLPEQGVKQVMQWLEKGGDEWLLSVAREEAGITD